MDRGELMVCDESGIETELLSMCLWKEWLVSIFGAIGNCYCCQLLFASNTALMADSNQSYARCRQSLVLCVIEKYCESFLI